MVFAFGWVGLKLCLGGVGLDIRLGLGQLIFRFGWLKVGFGLRWLRLVLDLGWPGLDLQLSLVQLGLELHFTGLGFGRTLETNWVELGTELGLGLVGVGVHVGGVRLCLLYLYDCIVGLEGCDGAGRGGQSVSVMTRGEGTSCSEGRGSVFGSGLVGLDVVIQWWNHLTRMSFPLVVR